MIPPFKTAEKRGLYALTRPVTRDEILKMARHLIQKRFTRGEPLTSPSASKQFLMLQLAELEYEAFAIVFLDNQHRVLSFEILFTGTIDSANVYPREVAKRTLQLNAKALILAHNHPSGTPDPSEADKQITRKLVDAMNLIDVRVLDHFVIGGCEVTSFAEIGLL